MNRRLPRLPVFWMVALTLGVGLGTDAAPAKPEPLKVPAENSLDARGIQDAARLAVARSVAYFQGLSTADPDGWFVPPLRQRKGVEWKTVEVRYSQRTVKEPIYEYETYETYVRVQDRSEGSAKVLKKVTQRRIKRQIGTKDVSRLVPDPNGSIIREHRQPIYGPGGPDLFREGVLGTNALIVYAMRTAGVGPDDAAVATVAGRLADFVTYYGIPDRTWDLSWMVSAFSVMPGERYERLTRTLVSRLLDGQITTGDARGLWGRMAISTEVLAAMMRKEAEFNEDYLRRKAQLAERATDLRKRRVEEAESELRSWQAKMKKISLRGTRLYDAETTFQIEAPGYAPVQVVGAAYFFYNQVAADMESTAVALGAVAAAADADRLPTLVERPADEKGNLLLRPQDTQAILARGANALATAQQGDGSWYQLNQHQPIHDFDRFEFLPVPADRNTFGDLPSSRTYLSAVQGLSGLLDAGRAVGMDKVAGRFAGALARGEKSQRHVAGLLAREGVASEMAGGLVPPYDLYYNLGTVHRQRGAPVEDRRGLWELLAWRLLTSVNPDGTWGTGSAPFITSSSKVRLEALPRVPHLNHETLKSAHISPQYYANDRHHLLTFAKAPVATAYALLFLIEGVRPPVAGVCSFGNVPADSPVLGQSVRFLRDKLEAPLTYEQVKVPFAYADITTFPVLFVRGEGKLTLAGETQEAVEDYLAGPGLVVVELPVTPSGAAFMNDWVALAKKVDTGASLKPLAEEGYLAGIKGDVTVRSVYREAGTPAIIFLPLPGGVGQAPPHGTLTTRQAAEITANILKFRSDPDLFGEGYPIAAGEPEELTERWKVAVAFLKGAATLPPPPIEAPAPAEPPVETPANPAPEDGAKPKPEPTPAPTPTPKPEPVENEPPPPADDEVW